MSGPEKKPSFYTLLGLRAGATTDEDVRAAYKKAVMTAHPDKPGGSAQQFRLVQEAYQSLGTAEKRKKYNESLKEVRKLRNFATIRPKPLPAVKKGHTHQLMDGSLYEFETAAEKMKCRYRHGDVVQGPTGCCGVIVGLAADGVYWVKDDHPFASLLFCPDFGGNADIHLLHREKRPREIHPTTRTKPAAARRESLRDPAIQALVEQERQAREHLEAAVEFYFDDCRRSLDRWAQSVSRKGPTSSNPKSVHLTWTRRREVDGASGKQPALHSTCFTHKPAVARPPARENEQARLAQTVPLMRVPTGVANETENQEPHPQEPRTPRTRPLCRSSSLSRGTRSTGLSESVANASSRSSSANASVRGTLNARRSDLQRVLDEARASRHQTPQAEEADAVFGFV